jgi:hypothetical protein
MKFSNSKKILLLTIAWALMLIGYDRLFNKHLFAPTVEAVKQFTNPQIRLWVNHLCCSGCADSALQAFKTIPWFGKPQVLEKEKLLTQDQANQTQGRSSYGKGLVLNVLDVSKVDFVTLFDALRKSGLIVGEAEFGGIPHYSLKIDVGRHLCCRLCTKALEEAMAPRQDPKFGSTLQWLESARVSQASKSVTAFVRIGHSADIGELMRTLDRAGFPPVAIRILVEKKEDLIFPPS